jgi:nitrite reductase/ring-hydroxylating ferredoxin subunit
MPPTSSPQHWFEVPHAPAAGTAVAHRDDLTDGEPKMLELDTGGGPAKPFRLVLLRDGEQVTAFVNRCPHFGVPLATQQSQLIFAPKVSLTCNVHYTRFRWSDGLCEAGQCAGDRLLAVPLAVADDGRVQIGVV